MSFEIRIARPADKARLRPETVTRIEEALRNLREDPLRPRPGADIKMLRGDRAYYRLRVGDYRVFYVVFVEERILVVVDVRHRRSAY